jgi:hypothetical protein
MTLGSTQLLREMSTRNIFWQVKRVVNRADNLNQIHVSIVIKYGNLNLLDLSGPV